MAVSGSFKSISEVQRTEVPLWQRRRVVRAICATTVERNLRVEDALHVLDVLGLTVADGRAPRPADDPVAVVELLRRAPDLEESHDDG